LTVSANNASRVYAAANPVFNGTVTGTVGSDSFTEAFTTTATATSNAGNYPIVPAVTGAQLANYTVTTANGTLTVTPAATATTLTAPESAVSGASVSLTATVTSSSGTPSGIVTFYSGTTSLGTGTLNGGGAATLSTTALTNGTDTVTAVYAAAGNFAASTSSAMTVTVSAAPVTTPATYTVAANPTSLTVQAGSTATTTLTFTPTGGYSGTIALSCSNLPTNASCAFAQNQVTLSGNNQSVNLGLTIQMTTQQAGKHIPSNTPNSTFTPALLALAFWWPGGLTGLAVFVRKRRLVKQRVGQLCLLIICTLAFAAGLSGCGMSGYEAHTTGPTSAQVTVVATGTSGGNVTTQSVVLTLSMMQ
jgi:predicted secreted protein